MIIAIKSYPGADSRAILDKGIIIIDSELSPIALASTLAHELGHVFDPGAAKLGALAYFRPSDTKIVASEIKAWRIAKAITPPALWDEKYALKAIKGYMAPGDMWKYWTRRFADKRIREYRKFKAIGIIPLRPQAPKG
jgi:hypothetical protein